MTIPSGLPTPLHVPSHPKVTTIETLAATIAVQKDNARRVVFTNGCYDIIHPGHVDLLARAKALGDVLVVGLNSDDSVRRQNKGANRPVNTFSVRAFVLAHLESVDFVVCFDEDTPYNLIQTIHPHVLVKGGDWPVEKIVGGDIVEENGGEIFSLALLPGFSTTATIRQIQAGESAISSSL